MSHSESLQKNLDSFKNDALKYDSIPAMQVLTDLFTLSMMQFPSATTDDTVLTADDIKRKFQAAHAKFLDPGSETGATLGNLLQPNTTLIDFACGTGLVASKVAPYISKGRIVGVDISEHMLGEFDAKAKSIRETFPDLDVSSVCGDVLSPDFDMEPLTGIADIVLCSLAFHHLHDYNKVAAKMKQMLKPGGWILVYDFYNEDQEKPLEQRQTEMGVSRHGMTLDEMKDALSDGCTNVSSTREYRVDVWHELPFIESHCCEEVRANLANAKRNGDFYLVSTSIVLGAAQKR